MLTYKKENQNIEFECRYNHFISKEVFSRAIAYYKAYSSPLRESVHDETLDIFAKGYRITIQGKPTIQRYCSTNSLSASDVSAIIIKRPIKGLSPVYLNSINFKVDVKEEVPVKDMTSVLTGLQNEPKMFRFKKRFSFADQKAGIRYDFTISKTSTGNTHTNFVDSGTLSSSEKYELEIESTKVTDDPYVMITKMIEAYMVINGSSGLVANKDKIVAEYLQLIKQDAKPSDVFRKPRRYMIGPHPVSIERKNVIQPPMIGVPNITEPGAYTVTEKTDGERHLMFIDSEGNVVLINSRFDLIPIAKLTGYKNCLFDGEWVSSQRLFALFDAYFANEVDLRSMPLIGTKSRLKTLQDFYKKTNKAFADESKVTLHLKEFLHGSILELSKSILDKQAKKEFPYHIDGLIFTPAHMPIPKDGYGTWADLLKWKPPNENTIDFLVKYERDNGGKPLVTIKDGKVHNVCTLYSGYQPTLNGDKMTALDSLGKAKNTTFQAPPSYMARRFIPPDYVGNDLSTFYASEGIEDDSIVEFAFDTTKNTWVPLRTRQDKTELFRKNGLSGTANDYFIALNIWKSIQNPVTSAMISGTQLLSTSDIPEDNVYYNRNTTRDKFASKAMMDFHNHWVKNHSLIAKVGGKRLLDLACGKGGDLNKWIKAGVVDVVGFDYVRDNIENPIDGVYARMSTIDMPSSNRYAFLTMDCSKVLSSAAAQTDEDREVAQILWGEGVSSKGNLSKYWDMMKDFDVVSCQFALHYFFENETTLQNFLTNVDKHLKPGGRFIGTCLDGGKVKIALGNSENIRGMKNGKVLWDITKHYTNTDEVKLGDAVDIYMESIGRVAREYLVNMRLLEARLRDMGYTCVFITGFDAVYDKVSKEATGVYADSLRSMSDTEKQYSFMNCMFCFEKNTAAPPPAKKKITIKKKT